MKNLINWLKKTPVFENFKKRVFLTRIRLFPEYRKKVSKKYEVEQKILLEAQNEIIQHIKTNVKESKFKIIQKITNDFVFSISQFGFFLVDYETIENELKKLDKHEKLEFLKDLENYFRIVFEKGNSKIFNEFQHTKQICRMALKTRDSKIDKNLTMLYNYSKIDENLTMLYYYSKIDKNNITDGGNNAIEWIKAKKIEYTTPGYENFDSYGLIERIITNSYDLNDVIFIVKDTFQKVKNKKEYKLWITAILKERIQSFKGIIQSMEKYKVIMNHRYANSANRLEFALKTINELDITDEFHNQQTTDNKEISNKTINPENINPYPRIFVDGTHFDLFYYLKTTVKNELADYSFIFRRMQKDNYIYESIKESEFTEWLNNEYQISIDKLKLLDYCRTDQKEKIYTTAKLIFKLN